MNDPVVIENLSHFYGSYPVYRNLSLRFEAGNIYALLGKNGVGKTTLIKILMGFLKPTLGRCMVLGDDSHALSGQTRARVGLLFERHLAYDFFSIEEAEKFYGKFYPRWRRDVFYEMAATLKLSGTHKIKNMSEGQRSQIVLGLLLAQDPELLILDDYSMGLDAGYRRLFVDYLAEYFKDRKHTVILTSHVIQDMDSFVDEAVFLERGGRTLRVSLKAFMETFRCLRLPITENQGAARRVDLGGAIKNIEIHPAHWDVFGFGTPGEIGEILRQAGIKTEGMHEIPMNLEDAFVGYTGRRQS